MKFSPSHRDLVIRSIYGALVVGAFVMMGIGTGVVRTVLLSVSLVSLAAGLYLFIRYELTTYTYIVMENGKRLDFYVDKAVGKRGAYVCYFPLSDAKEFCKYTKGVKKEISQKHGKTFFYKYYHNAFSAERYVMVFQNDGYCDAVIMELDRASVEYLSGAMKI